MRTAPASFAQERLWFLHQLTPQGHAYHDVVALEISGPLDIPLVENCLNELIARHESLRTTFTFTNGRVMQVIAPELRISVTQTEWRSDLRAFDPEHGPLIRANVERRGPGQYLLTLTIHHLVTDGWSNQILLQEFGELYTAGISGGKPELPPLPISFADYAIRQRGQSAQAGLHLAYWKEQLGTNPVPLDLPADHPRGRIQSFDGARESVLLPESLHSALLKLSRRERCSLFMTLMAAFQVLLARYTSQDVILTGIPIAGRTRTDTERLVGCLINTLVLRTDLSGNPTFVEVMARVRKTALDAYNHQDVPFERVVEALVSERDASRTPLFDVMFQLRNVPKKPLAIPGLQITPVSLDTGTAKLDLYMEAMETAGGLACLIEYNTGLFDAATIRRMLGHYEMLLQSAAERPDSPVFRLPMLTEPERRQLLVEWNDTTRDFPADCIHTLFERQAARTPEIVAVRYDNRSLTYAALNARANQVAHWLQSRGVRAGDFVGLRMERSLEMVAGMLGILKAGAAYVPLSPAYPGERLSFMIEDSRLAVVLDPEDEEAISRQPAENPAKAGTAESIAYVIYTSGSTGKPKGVAVPHRGVIRLVVNTDYLQLRPQDVVAQISNASFDAATFEIWGALLNGARLEGISQDAILTPADLESALVGKGITAMFITAALFDHMARLRPAAFQTVGTVIFGGEPATPARVADVLAKGAPRRLVNGYGPTETTTFATWHEVKAVNPNQKTIPIGRPIANTELYVLDRQFQPCPIGVAGELYIGGPGVASGYVNRPELTAERFIPHLFKKDPGLRLYRTGDKVKYLPGGDLEFLGRFDQQVKIRGWRIEPGEVEAQIALHPDVQQSAVIVREDEPGEKRLVAYVVPCNGRRATAVDLLHFLRERLPEYMLPSAIVAIPEIPVNANGKVDRSALPKPVGQSDSDNPYAGPRTRLEHQLVHIWELLLGVSPISLHDNFFDLGGHSLLAVQMADHIQKACGKRLPLSAFITGATIERIAGVLNTQADCHGEQIDERIVPVQRSGSRPPLFLMHGDLTSGGVYSIHVARRLGPDQPLYVLNPHRAGCEYRLPSISAMAEENLGKVLEVDPEGPFYLAGMCNGAVVAYEMALQLRRMGKDVAMLVMIDPSRVDRIFRTVIKRFSRLVAAGPLPPELLALVPWLRDNDASMMEQVKAYLRVLGEYEPQPLDRKITLLWNAEKPLAPNGDKTHGWGRLASAEHIATIPGDHFTCISKHVDDLSAAIAHAIERSAARAGRNEAALRA